MAMLNNQRVLSPEISLPLSLKDFLSNSNGWLSWPSGKRLQKTMENHHAINGKIHYFDWAIFKIANCNKLPEGIPHISPYITDITMGSIPHWPTRYISGLWHMGYPVTEENPWKSMVSRKNDIHIDLYFHLSHIYIYIYNLLAILDFFLVISVIHISLAGKGHLSHFVVLTSQVRFLWYSMFGGILWSWQPIRFRSRSIKPSGYGSIPIDTFLVGWTSINPSYFGVNRRYQGFDPSSHLAPLFSTSRRNWTHGWPMAFPSLVTSWTCRCLWPRLLGSLVRVPRQFSEPSIRGARAISPETLSHQIFYVETNRVGWWWSGWWFGTFLMFPNWLVCWCEWYVRFMV